MTIKMINVVVVILLITIVFSALCIDTSKVQPRPTTGGITTADVTLESNKLSPEDAAKLDENTVYVSIQNTTTISSKISAEADKIGKQLTSYENATLVAKTTDETFKEQKFPITIENKETSTNITITKYMCTIEMCGYWITAERDGKEVKTNSPIWISPPPYKAVKSETYDSDKNQVTVTIDEDPMLAVERVLSDYVDRQPLGKGTG